MESEDFSALVVDAEDSRSGGEALLVEVVKERVDQSGGWADRPTNGIANARDACRNVSARQQLLDAATELVSHQRDLVAANEPAPCDYCAGPEGLEQDASFRSTGAPVAPVIVNECYHW